MVVVYCHTTMYLRPNVWKKLTCLTWQQTLPVHHQCDLSSELKFTSVANASCWASTVSVHKHLNWRQVMELVTVTLSRADINTWQWKQLGNSETGLQNKNKSHQLHKISNYQLWKEERRARFKKSVTIDTNFRILWKNLETCWHVFICL